MAALLQLLKPSARIVEVSANQKYAMAGMLNHGRGLFSKGEISGIETSYKKLTKLEADQFVYSRLFAWEGSTAVVPSEFDGAYVSPEFPAFDIDTTQLLPSFLAHIARWPEFHFRVAGGRKGLGLRRQRVSPEALLSVEIPLPGIAEQRRIAHHLDQMRELDLRLGSAIDKLDRHPAAALLPDLIDYVLQSASPNRVLAGSLYNVVSDVVHPGDAYNGADCFVGLQHIESHTGKRFGSISLGDETGRKFRFQPKDVVFGYLRPYLNKVWVADRTGLCSVDQYVLRATTGVDPHLLAYCLRSRSTLLQTEALTHNLQLPRLRTKLLQGITVADPRAMLKVARLELDRLTAKTERLALQQSHRRRIASALMPAALNQAFSGLA